MTGSNAEVGVEGVIADSQRVVAWVSQRSERALTLEHGHMTASNSGRPRSVISLRTVTAILTSVFCLLVFEAPRFQFWPDDTLPATDLCLDSAALIVSAAGLPSQAALGVYFRDVTVALRRFIRGLRAGNGVLRRWDDDFNGVPEALFEQIAVRRAIIGTVRQKSGNRAVDLIQEPGQSCRIANVVQGQISANDFTGYKVETEVQLAPGFAFGPCVMLVLQPLALTEDLQPSAVHHQMDRKLARFRARFA